MTRFRGNSGHRGAVPADGRGPRRALARATVLAAAVAAAACSGKDWRVQQLYGGPVSMEILAAPDTVEAFRIDPRLPAPDPAAPRIGDFNIRSGPVAVGAAEAAELTAILRDPETYDWWTAKGCEFRPGVGLRIVRNSSRVEIALCFECDELMIFRHGRRVNMEDFDSARPRLVALAKSLFPGDAEIQALR